MVLHFEIADKVKHVVTDTASNMVKALHSQAMSNEMKKIAKMKIRSTIVKMMERSFPVIMVLLPCLMCFQ